MAYRICELRRERRMDRMPSHVSFWMLLMVSCILRHASFNERMGEKGRQLMVLSRECPVDASRR